ncbi:MAG: tRNA (cytidine(34)-2'-O)-methyltransferase [Verrucomicrobiota bacterium]
MTSQLNIALIEPEIPPNTGNIARFCAACGFHLDLVGPLGFSLDQKHLKRAGMDYWQYLDHAIWDSRQDYFSFLLKQERRFFLLTTKAEKNYCKVKYEPGDTLIFGRETKGLPESLLQQYPYQCLTIPMSQPHARSLNLATSAAIVAFEAKRQLSEL